MAEGEHPGEHWRFLERQEQLQLMQNMHDTYVYTRDLFDQMLWNEELRRDWKDTLGNIAHDGNQDARNLKRYIDKKDPVNGWRSTHRTFSWIRLMNFLMFLAGDRYGA